MIRLVRGVAGVAAVVGCLLVTSCTAEPTPTPSPPPAPATPPPTLASPSGSATPSEIPEPTTTNTLPPPPAPTAPAPSTAGALNATTLPVPRGWRKANLKGGNEEGFRGNGTWVHARDARYAAQDAITIGCSQVTRDDYADPKSALEGDYQGPRSAPGVGLVLDFGDQAKAAAYFDLYRRQVQACTTTNDPLRTTIIASKTGLVDRRTYPDSQWTEVARQTGARVTLIILSDPKRKISAAAAGKILDQIGG